MRHYGDAIRAGRVATALVDRLRADARVLAAYERCAGIADDLVAAGPHSDAVDAEIRLRIHAELQRLVDHQLALPYRWLPALLARDFMAWLLTRLVAHEQSGADVALRIEVVPPDRDQAPDLPKGQVPYVDLARDVDWFYRARIAAPPETVYAIAKADLPFKGKAPNHSQVLTAIARTEAALRLLDVDAPPV